jgi:hypothetical protein
MNIFTQFFNKFFGKSFNGREIERDLIRGESEIGRTVFGPVPYGVKREFFCLDVNTWIWHEEKDGQKTITRYKIQQNEIIKSINGGHYERLSIEEARRFVTAIKTYKTRVKRDLYQDLSFA